MKSIVVGTAGHIDHGKSTLVRALTGSDPDRLKDEKARGITIDLGFAHCRLDDLNVAFVDVPGHERFVRNMLAGASGIDCVLLVVAADESVMPQTREHFDICRLLQVKHGVVALTKCDHVDTETVELVRLEVGDLVDNSFLAGAPVIPVSARDGTGLNDLRAALVEVAEAVEGRSPAGTARLPVDRAFTVRGFGTVVTGTLKSGRLAVNAALDVLPSGRRVKVRGLQVHGEAQDSVGPGQRVAVNLAGVEVTALVRGDVLVESGGLEVTRRLDATLSVLPGVRPLKHGARVRFHEGTSEVMARVSLAGEVGAVSDHVAPAVLEPGSDAYVRLRLEQPVAVTRGDRFVLRAYSPIVTIAGGEVLDPVPAKGRLRSSAGLARLRRLSIRPNDLDFLVAMVVEAGTVGLTRERIIPRAGVAVSELDEVVGNLVGTGHVSAIGSVLIAPSCVTDLSGELLGWVAAFHKARPLEAGLPREEARERFCHRSSSELFDTVVEVLAADGTLSASDHLALTSHHIELSVEEQEVQRKVEECYCRAGLSPPDATAVSAQVAAPEAMVDRMLRLLLREHALVKVESLVFHAQALEKLKQGIADLKRDGVPGEIDVASFKARFRVTRKYAIPLLGYLDRERITRRVGQVRVVL